MQKISYTRTVTNYEFSPPPLLNEEEYILLKKQLNKDLNAKIFKSSNIQQTASNMYIAVFISAICLLIGLIGLLSSDKSSWGFPLVLVSLLVLFPLVSGGKLEIYNKSRKS